MNPQPIDKSDQKIFRAWGQLLGESGVQVVVFFLLPVVGSDAGKTRWSQSINTWLRGGCHHHSLRFFDDGMANMAPGFLLSDGIPLSQRARGVLLRSWWGRMGSQGGHVSILCWGGL